MSAFERLEDYALRSIAVYNVLTTILRLAIEWRKCSENNCCGRVHLSVRTSLRRPARTAWPKRASRNREPSLIGYQLSAIGYDKAAGAAPGRKERVDRNLCDQRPKTPAGVVSHQLSAIGYRLSAMIGAEDRAAPLGW
jgi:hypothetical protein